MTDNECFPKRLWKYREWNSYTRELIVEGELYYSKPSSLNDPFEFCWSVKIPNSDAEIIRFIKDLLAQEFPDDTIPQRRMKFEKLKQEAFESKKNYGEIRLSNNGHTIGVFSATEKNNDILMWTHYASNHTGVCVSINPSKVKNFFHPVSYVTHFPVIDAFDYLDPKFDFLELCCKKSVQWGYEKEWRSGDIPGANRFPGCVDRVVLGSRVTDKTRQEVEDAVMAASQDIEVVQARLSDREYSLAIPRFSN